MIFDGHIHIHAGKANRPAFQDGLAMAGVSGGLVISESPNCFRKGAPSGDAADARKRLDGLFERTHGILELYPFFWIDPLEEDAEEQVTLACGYGVQGFKIICDRYYPYDSRPMEIIRKIAAKGKPILFHSGILWDGKFSSLYNKPVNFEALIEVEGLRFSLAHASWPWCDECIALYGKIRDAKASGNGPNVEMFIDITPGTPEIYRRELLTKLYTVGYDVENNVVFGTDCVYDSYTGNWAKRWIDMDTSIYGDLKLEQEAVSKVFALNLRRFIGG